MYLQYRSLARYFRLDNLSSSMEDGEKQDIAKEVQSEQLEEGKMKKKKRRHGQKIEKPEAVMANFFKALEIYQIKMLVSFS